MDNPYETCIIKLCGYVTTFMCKMNNFERKRIKALIQNHTYRHMSLLKVITILQANFHYCSMISYSEDCLTIVGTLKISPSPSPTLLRSHSYEFHPPGHYKICLNRVHSYDKREHYNKESIW